MATLVSAAPNVSREWRAVCCDETYGPKVHLNLFELQKTLRIRPKYWYEWLESRINTFSWVVEINFKDFEERMCVVTDDTLLKIAQMHEQLLNLKTLNLSTCRHITDTGLLHVAQLTQLTTLDLSYCRMITNAGLIQVAHLTDLTTLKLGRCYSITDRGLEHIAQLTDLTGLDLA